MKLEWEIIEESKSDSARTQRLKVHGGWIVERIAQPDGRKAIVYHYFIEDPDHLWGAPKPEKVKVNGAEQCPNPDCEEWAYICIGERGGKCLACKTRWCKTCGSNLATEDLGEKCLQCGTFNEID